MFAHPLISLVLLSAPPVSEGPLSIPAQGLTVDLQGPEELEVTHTADSGQVRRSWTGKLGRTELEVDLILLSHEEFELGSPEEVVDVCEWNMGRDTPEGESAFSFDEKHGIEGAFGYTPYAWVGIQTGYEGTMKDSNFVCMGGIAREAAWAFEVKAKPALSEKNKAKLLEILAAAISYEGETQVAEWTDEEVENLWKTNAPERVLEQSKLNILRTDHYVILTDMRTKGGTGRKIAKKMEERYVEIQKLYPFQEIKGRRLMPIYIFRDPDNYYAFLVKSMDMTQEEAERTAGIAFGPFYATSYNDPGDPVHIHEMTHQIFRNRLQLSGGGSWYQEGVAEFIEGSKNDRKAFRNAAKKGKHLPLRDLFQKESLIFSTAVDKKHGDQAGSLYLQCACLIEFLHESKFGEGKFEAFLHGMGSVRRNDLASIEATFRRIYGVDIDALEAEFLEYWKKR